MEINDFEFIRNYLSPLLFPVPSTRTELIGLTLGDRF
jgi:hypothetical protein